MAKKMMIALLAMLALTQNAWGAETGGADWSLREVRRGQGSLDYCITERNFYDGRRLNVARDPEGRMNLGLILPDQRWTVGETLELQLAFDKQPPQKMVALAHMPSMLLLEVVDGKAFGQKLAAARRLTITGAGKKQNVALGHIASALQELEQCTAQQSAALPAATLDILQQAGVGDGAMPIDPPPGLSFTEFAWQRGGIIGGTQAFAPTPDFRAAVRGQLTILQNFCQGLWSEDVGLILVAGKIRQQQAVLTCVISGREEVMAIVFHQAADGSARYYAHTGGGKNRAAVESATAALAKFLLTMERN